MLEIKVCEMVKSVLSGLLELAVGLVLWLDLYFGLSVTTLIWCPSLRRYYALSLSLSLSLTFCLCFLSGFLTLISLLCNVRPCTFVSSLC